MNLRTKLFSATSVIVLVILGLSEWIGYRLMAQFLSNHEMRMATNGRVDSVLAELRQGRLDLLFRLSMLHLFHAAATIFVLVGVLNWLWNRAVVRPLRDLLSHINYMGRGSWTTAVPVRTKDEIGELTEAFNRMGGQLTVAVHQFGAASKLSAMALLGQSMVRKALSAAELLRASEADVERDCRLKGGDATALRARLHLAIEFVDEIPRLFDSEFRRQLDLHLGRSETKAKLPLSSKE